MEIPENMDQWNVLEKMEQWDTSTTTHEDILKDLNPYLNYVIDKLKAVAYDLNPQSVYVLDELNALDDSILPDLDVLKKVLPRIEPFYRNLLREVDKSNGARKHAMDAIYKLPGHNNDKLKKVLNDQTALTEFAKKKILEVWEQNHSRYHCWCLLPSDTTLMEECIRTNSAIISDVFDKEEELTRRFTDFDTLVGRTKDAANTFSPLTYPSVQINRRANSIHQLERCDSTKHKRLKSTSSPKASGHQLKRCESTKHKRLKSTSPPKASGHQLKRCKSTKHKRLKSTSSPKASGHQLKRCESTKHKRLKSTSSPKASGQ